MEAANKAAKDDGTHADLHTAEVKNARNLQKTLKDAFIVAKFKSQGDANAACASKAFFCSTRMLEALRKHFGLPEPEPSENTGMPLGVEPLWHALEPLTHSYIELGQQSVRSTPYFRKMTCNEFDEVSKE